MKRILASLLAVLCLALPVDAFNWEKVIAKVSPSVVQLFTPHFSCTAFSINEQATYYLTDAHCFDEQGMVLMKDGEQILVEDVVYHDPEHDLMVLDATKGLPGLKLNKIEAPLGSEVLGVGHAFGTEQLHFMSANVSSYVDGHQFLDNTVIPGMSGGPVVNTEGKVVGIVQAYMPQYGVSLHVMRDTLKKLVGKYWGR